MPGKTRRGKSRHNLHAKVSSPEHMPLGNHLIGPLQYIEANGGTSKQGCPVEQFDADWSTPKVLRYELRHAKLLEQIGDSTRMFLSAKAKVWLKHVELISRKVPS